MGVTDIEGLLEGEDVLRTAAAMTACGAAGVPSVWPRGAAGASSAKGGLAEPAGGCGLTAATPAPACG